MSSPLGTLHFTASPASMSSILSIFKQSKPVQSSSKVSKLATKKPKTTKISSTEFLREGPFINSNRSPPPYSLEQEPTSESIQQEIRENLFIQTSNFQDEASLILSRDRTLSNNLASMGL